MLGLKLPVNEHIPVDFVLLNMALIVFLFSSSTSEFMNLEEQHAFIEDRRADYNFSLPLKIDVDDIFSRAGIEKSTILLYTALGSLEDVETLPMGSRRRNEILDRFFTVSRFYLLLYV